jgi:hypothetical protein
MGRQNSSTWSSGISLNRAFPLDEEVTMAAPARDILNRVAQDLGLSEDDLLRQGLRCFLEQQLRKANTDMFEICGRYGVKNVNEMELRYKDGSLKESESWTDLQKLDHLEYKRDQLLNLLEAIIS